MQYFKFKYLYQLLLLVFFIFLIGMNIKIVPKKYECVLFTSLITIYKTSQSGTVGSRESAVLDIPPTMFTFSSKRAITLTSFPIARTITAASGVLSVVI